MSFQLFVISGPDQGRIFDLNAGTTVIGRSREADVCLSDPRVSRRQCIIEVNGKDLDVADLGSTLGTFVNAHPVTGLTSIKPEDEIRVGETSLYLVLQDQAANTTVRNSGAETHTDLHS